MRTYQIYETTQEIEVGGQQVRALLLGEAGRGRKQTKVLVKAEEGLAQAVARKVGNPVIQPSVDPVGWLARISTQGAYIRGANGNLSIAPDQQGVTVITKGYGAFGLAGRTGTWDDLLLAIDDQAIIRVKPSRGPAYLLCFGKQDVQRISYADADLLGIDVGESTESGRGDWVRL